MDAPPVQYTKTSDGYSIAYMVSGQGPSIVVLPQVFQHCQRIWTSGPLAKTLGYLSHRFRIVQYDSRGQGLSQRDLPEGTTLEGYLIDLEAVCEACGPGPVVLFAAQHFGHIGVRYAVKHPDGVSAVVLHNTSIERGGNAQSNPMFSDAMLQLHADDWEASLAIVARSGFPTADITAVIDYFHAAADRKDQLKLLNLIARSSIRDIAASVEVPVLLVASPNNPITLGSSDYGVYLAPLIPRSRLVVRDNALARVGDTTELALLAEEFIDGIESSELAKRRVLPDGLSAREVEVLRLIAAGRSNAQIAEELVISPSTVLHHVTNIFSKTGSANRTEAATYRDPRRLGLTFSGI